MARAADTARLVLTPLSRSAPRAGLVTLRQSFVHRCQCVRKSRADHCLRPHDTVPLGALPLRCRRLLMAASTYAHVSVLLLSQYLDGVISAALSLLGPPPPSMIPTVALTATSHCHR